MSLSDPLQGKYIVRPNGCWEWQRAIQTNGYGSVGYEGKTHLAHRLSYQLYVGPIPAGHDIHHKCQNRPCINPAHLEPKLHEAHSLLADTPFRRNAAKTHCPRGHAFTPENTLTFRGHRQCRICVNAQQRERRASAAQARRSRRQSQEES